MRTSFADELICEDSIEQVLHYFLFFGAFDKVFNPVDEHIEELIDISLNHRVYRLSIYVLKRKAELLGVEVLLLDFLKCAKDSLDLVQDVGCFSLCDRLLVFDFEHGFAERSDHEKLLHDTVHVADTSDVFKSDVPCRRFLLLVISGDTPIGCSCTSPEK